MKEDLKDATFLLLVRLDSIQRLENLIVTTDLICKYFNTNIIVREAANFNNHIVEKLLNKNSRYEFVEDKDPILHKTKHFNDMTRVVTTPFLAIWDADIILEKKSMKDIIGRLRKNECDVALPYNGICMNVPEIIRTLFLKKKEIGCLYRNIHKMEKLHINDLLVGGAIMMKTDQFIAAGMENELHYGWGNDDFDRYYRLRGLACKIYRVHSPLFHLMHPRGVNSRYHSFLGAKISSQEVHKLKNSSEIEIMGRIKTDFTLLKRIDTVI
jgi:predicted glycosyltransferase involved in capsule biosynthesis